MPTPKEIDDAAVDEFAVALKATMDGHRATGRPDWQDNSGDALAGAMWMVIQEGGTVLDVGAFAAMSYAKRDKGH